MKNIILVLSSLLVFSFSSVSQYVVHDANAEERKVDQFNSIEVSNALTVYLTQGSSQAVAVSAVDEKSRDKIKTEVKNGVLKIYVETSFLKSFNWNDKKMKAYITCTQLKNIELSGATVVNIPDKISSKELNIDLSGASSIKGKLEINDLKVELSGASSANLKGSASQAKIVASGASSFNSYELEIDNCKAQSSGASSVKIATSKELTAKATGASSIYYKGDPTMKGFESSGSSTIKKKN